jgi:hypothetical protein
MLIVAFPWQHSTVYIVDSDMWLKNFQGSTLNIFTLLQVALGRQHQDAAVKTVIFLRIPKYHHLILKNISI